MDQQMRPFTRRQFLGAASAISIAASGCLRLIGSSNSTETPSSPSDANFDFRYDEGKQTLHITYETGVPLTAGQVQIRSSDGDSVRWNELGSTSVAGSETISPGDTAVLAPDVLNWENGIEATESLRIVYIASDGSPTTLARFDPAQTPSSTPGSPPTETFFEGFEDGSVSGWEISSNSVWEPSTQRTLEGSYSAYLGRNGSSGVAASLTMFPDGRKISEFTYHWQETENQGGFALHFYDSDGNYVVGTGSDNPQWRYNRAPDDRNTVFHGGDGYNRWIQFTHRFDWENGSVTVRGKDLQFGSTSKVDVSLATVSDISTVKVGHHHAETKSHDMWFDNLEATV